MIHVVLMLMMLIMLMTKDTYSFSVDRVNHNDACYANGADNADDADDDG